VLNLKTGLFLSAALFASSSFADTQAVELSALSNGTEVEATYMASCFACHSTGAAGAPKVGPGNADAWTARLEKGMDQVVTNAIAGINNMPPKGLCFTCNDDDIKQLVEYMVDSSK
jgi:cytochrome c5